MCRERKQNQIDSATVISPVPFHIQGKYSISFYQEAREKVTIPERFQGTLLVGSAIGDSPAEKDGNKAKKGSGLACEPAPGFPSR